MINTSGLIAETAARIFADLSGSEIAHAAEAGTYPQLLWDTLIENGLHLAWTSEEQGGFAIGADEIFGMIWASAQAAAPVPFAETLIANWLLDQAGMAPAEGSASFAMAESGGMIDIAFGEHAEEIVLFDSAQQLVSRFKNPVEHRAVIDSLSPDRMTRFNIGDHIAVESAATNLSRQSFEAIVLTVRAVQMAAAIESALDLSLDYVNQREQFGRPLAKFQAIQHQLAVAASESAAATMAATQAASAIIHHHDNLDHAWHEAVIAKVQIGHSVEAVTVPFHQVHGAIGYTQEYRLHHYTRRLWAWRDMLGNEHHWSAILGAQLAARSPDEIWQGVTTGDWTNAE